MNSFKNQEILLVCYYFPPIKSIAVLRAYNLHIELKTHFRAIHVLTTSNRKRLQTEFLPLMCDSLHISPTFDYRTISSFGKTRHTHFPEDRKTGIISWLLKINNSFPFNILVGEGGIVYIICGFLKATKLIRQKNVKYVYSSFMPYADHIIAYLLSIVYGNKIIWIADFRDLHVDPIYRHVVFVKFQHWVWRKILSRASFLTTVSKGLEKHLCKYNPKVYVMKNGIGRLHSTFDQQPLQNNEKFTIAYTGSYYKQESPEYLFESIKQLIQEGIIAPNNIQIKYAGKDGAIWSQLILKYGLSSVFSNEGLVTLKMSNEIQASSHINLLLTSSSKERTGMLSGKLYEYLAAGVPILLIINGEHDLEFEQIFTELECGAIFLSQETELKALKNFIEIKYSKWLRSEKLSNRIINNDKLITYKWPYLANELIKKMATYEKNNEKSC